MRFRTCIVPVLRAPASRGSALVVVLWLIGLLSLIVTAFAFDAHLETRIAGFARRRRQAEALALSGLSVTEMLLQKQREVSPNDPPDPEDRWHPSAVQLARGLPLKGLTEPLGEGHIVLDIMPEDSRRNVNRFGQGDRRRADEDWERILEVGDIPMERWPELIDAFFHWTDPNYRGGNSAEFEDYYQRQEPPYRAKQADLDTVQELLLVKGFDHAILFGGVLNPETPVAEQIRISGIQDLLTTYGQGLVNVNAANERVLMTLPGVDWLTARAIREERGDFRIDDADLEHNPAFDSPADFVARIPELPPEIAQYIVTRSTIFRVTATGQVGRTSRRIEAIVEWETGRNRMHVLRWREEP